MVVLHYKIILFGLKFGTYFNLLYYLFIFIYFYRYILLIYPYKYFHGNMSVLSFLRGFPFNVPMATFI